MHVATKEWFAAANGASVSSMVIYSCNWKNITCNRRVVSNANSPTGSSLPGHSLTYWPLNDYLYLTYIPNGGYFGYSALHRCSLNSYGDITGNPICTESQFADLDKNNQPADTPSIAFAGYLGSVVVLYRNIGHEGLIFVQYDADLSGDPKYYQYNSPKYNMRGYDSTSSPGILNIDPATVLMRTVYTYTNVSDAMYHLHIGDVDIFPSKVTASSILSFSPGYSVFYPPPLRPECVGTPVDTILSCHAVIRNGACTQAWIFSGGGLTHPYIEHQPCYPKEGYGLKSVYQRLTNPNSQYACVVLDNSKPPFTYFDDGPSIPLAADLLVNIVSSGIPYIPVPSTPLSSIVASALPAIFSSKNSLPGNISPGLLFAATSSRLAFWPGGIAHDYCYHNTVHYKGYNKDMCDAMVYKRWAIACASNYVSILFGIISDIAKEKFPGESVAECEVLAFLYYVVLRTSNTAQQAYLASNSNVSAPSFSSIPDGFSFGNRPPDPSLLHQNAVLVNSTAYRDSNNAVKTNLTRYVQLLSTNPLISTPVPVPAPPFAPSFAPPPFRGM